MPQIAAKKKPPGGRRVGATEMERRRAEVERLLMEGHPRSVIVAALGKMGCAPRTTDDHVRRVRDAWVRQRAESEPFETAETVQRLLRLARKLEAQGAWTALVQVERLLADVRGVRSRAEPVALPAPSSAQRMDMSMLCNDELVALDRLLSKLSLDGNRSNVDDYSLTAAATRAT